MTHRFVLFDETFRNPPVGPPMDAPQGVPMPPPPPQPPATLATAETEEEARALMVTTFAGRPDLTWIAFQLEEDGVTHCNGCERRDLMP